jgi:hypothetical protein
MIADSYASRACNGTARTTHVHLEIEILLLCSGAKNTLVQSCALLNSGIVVARPIQSIMHDKPRQFHEPNL